MTHDIEEVLLDDLFNVHVESTGVVNCISLCCSLVHVTNCDRRSEFFCEKAAFSDKLPVNAGDISTRVYQYRGVNNFESV